MTSSLYNKIRALVPPEVYNKDWVIWDSSGDMSIPADILEFRMHIYEDDEKPYETLFRVPNTKDGLEHAAANLILVFG